jgi:hypothetical protein
MSRSPASCFNNPHPEIPKTVIGGLFLLLRELLPDWPTSIGAMLQGLGVGKSQCYELKERLRDTLPELLHPPGRPPASSEPDAELATLKACYNYVTANPGSVCPNHSRQRYSPEFRHFMVDLVASGGAAFGISLENLARVSNVPLGTLKDWLSTPVANASDEALPEDGGAPAGDEPATGHRTPLDVSAFDSIRDARIKTIFSQWPAWAGTFQAFCQAMSLQFAIPYGSTLIGNILQATGLRDRKPRITPKMPWSKHTFRTLFPGAQWLGDGTTLAVHWNGQRHLFNIEALLDTATNAMVGIAVTDTEDAQALHLAYEASLETTLGVAPWAVTLDNKACNICDAAVAAFDGSTVLYGTPGRGQSKAALEGAFGLFAQSMPALDIQGGTDREMARAVLRTILTAWYRGRNGRPRQRLKGRTPVQVFFEDGPNPEQVAELKKWLEELLRRQDAIRLTREARLDPVRIGLLKKGLAELGISDPDDRLAKGLACFSRDAIMRGLAIFEAKRDEGNLPQESHSDGAYLGGIISNKHTQLELERVAVHLMKQRLRARDLSLDPLTLAAEKLRARHSKGDLVTGELVKDFLEHALAAPYKIDFLFWAKAMTDAFAALPRTQREALHKTMIRRVTAASKVDPDRRADLIDRLAAAVVLSTINNAA